MDEPEVRSAGTVAIVGFPNVGKSTLVNRLTESRAAVVHETAGVTRDRKELLADWNGVTFRIVDTGGVDEADTGPFGRHIAEQAKAAIAEADLVLFVVDARAGITPGDEELAAILRAADKPVIVLEYFGVKEKLPVQLEALSDERVEWNERSIADAIRRQARHEDTARWDVIDFKLD